MCGGVAWVGGGGGGGLFVGNGTRELQKGRTERCWANSDYIRTL